MILLLLLLVAGAAWAADSPVPAENADPVFLIQPKQVHFAPRTSKDLLHASVQVTNRTPDRIIGYARVSKPFLFSPGFSKDRVFLDPNVPLEIPLSCCSGEPGNPALGWLSIYHGKNEVLVRVTHGSPQEVEQLLSQTTQQASALSASVREIPAELILVNTPFVSEFTLHNSSQESVRFVATLASPCSVSPGGGAVPPKGTVTLAVRCVSETSGNFNSPLLIHDAKNVEIKIPVYGYFDYSDAEKEIRSEEDRIDAFFRYSKNHPWLPATVFVLLIAKWFLSWLQKRRK